MGSKKSTSSQSQTTNNADNRFVADAGSVGISGSGNTVNMTDSGLVQAGFDYLNQADAMITERNNATLTIAGNTAKMVIDAGMKAGADAVSAAVNTLGTIDRAQSGQGKFDNSQILAALIGAGALILTVKG